MEKFDYESKLWGGTEVRLSPFYLGASRLKFVLDDLKDIGGMDSMGSPCRVLEVGCGGGGMAKAIKFYRPDLEVFGVDIAREAILTAKADPQGVNFRLGDAHKLPFKDKSFEAVVMLDLLEHLDDPPKALQEAYRVLKPRGTFSAFIPIEGDLFSIHGWMRRLLGFVPKEKCIGHIQQYTLAELKVLFGKVGLKILRRRYFGHLFNQLTDFSYFTLFYLLEKKVPSSVEGYLAQNRGFKRSLISFFKSTIALASYVESELFQSLPASGVHLTAVKS